MLDHDQLEKAPDPILREACMHTDFLKNELEDFVLEALERWHVPGMALAVVGGDRVLHCAGYGQRDPARGLPVTPETLFPIASCTKSFTVTALGLLVDEGKLDWNKPVRIYLPDWQMYDPVATETLIVRDMLSHRSGLPAHDWLWLGSDFSRRELLARLRYLEPSAPLRVRFQYQNIMYMVASLLVEEIAGISWEHFVQTRIFDVLGMKRSNFSTIVTQRDPDHARPHVYRDGQLRASRFYEQDGENCATGSAGTICSCAGELTGWLSLQMNAGQAGEQQFIRPETLETMHLPHIFIDDPAVRRRFGYEFMSYGLGWELRSHKGQVMVSHGGSVDGFWCTLYFMPRHRLGVAALSNCDEGRNAVPPIVALTIFDRLLGLAPTDWHWLFNQTYDEAAAAEKQAEDAAAARTPGVQPAHPLDAYTGEYEHLGYGSVSVCLEDGCLQMVMNEKRTFAMTHCCDDVFDAHEAEWNDHLKLSFATDAQGRIGHLSIPLEKAVSDIIFVRR